MKNSLVDNNYLILAGWCSQMFPEYLDFTWNNNILYIYFSLNNKIKYSKNELIHYHKLPL